MWISKRDWEKINKTLMEQYKINERYRYEINSIKRDVDELINIHVEHIRTPNSNYCCARKLGHFNDREECEK